MIVVLPEPEGPMRAAFSPGSIVRLTLRRTDNPGLEACAFAAGEPGKSRFSSAYAKATFRISTQMLFFLLSSTAWGLSVTSGGVFRVSMAVRMAGMFQLIWCSIWPIVQMLSLTLVAYI